MWSFLIMNTNINFQFVFALYSLQKNYRDIDKDIFQIRRKFINKEREKGIISNLDFLIKMAQGIETNRLARFEL